MNFLFEKLYSLLLPILLTENICTTAKAPAEEVEAVAGLSVSLPCRIRNVDRLVIILWFRRKDSTPFYSFDARLGNLSTGSGKVHDENLGPRSRLILLEDVAHVVSNLIPGLAKANRIPIYPGWLEIRDLKRKDSGAYTCRAEFEDAPTQTHQLKLTVYEKPDSIEIKDEFQRPLRLTADGILLAGPVDEGDTLKLTCWAKGGWPEPHLEWFLDGHPLSGRIEDSGNGRRSNLVELTSISREDVHKILSCRVSNNPISKPNVTNVMIDMNLRPTSVVILTSHEGIDSGEFQELMCVTHGSHPPANITWEVHDGKPFKPFKTVQMVNEDGATQGHVRWPVTTSDDSRLITCLATNPRNQKFKLSNDTTLVVYHKPIVNLSIGRGLDPKKIREGIDVYFTCNVRANPIYDSIEFFREGIPISVNISKGILVIEKSLILQKVPPKASGTYSCRANNSKGTTNSNGVALSVQFKPRCKKSFSIIGVNEGGNLTIDCSVESLPKIVHFSWSVNSSEGLKILLRDQFVVEGQKSILSYQMPNTNKKVELYCIASNKLGEQSEPCKTTLVTASIPERVTHCSLAEQHSRSLRITCIPAGDGVTKQTYQMQIFERGTGQIVANQSSESPLFTVFNLAPGMDYVIHVYSINSKGTSPPYLLEGYSLKVAENRMDSTDDRTRIEGFSTLIALFLGVVVTLVILASVLVITARNRCRKAGRGEGIVTGSIKVSTTAISSADVVSTDGQCLSFDEFPKGTSTLLTTVNEPIDYGTTRTGLSCEPDVCAPPEGVQFSSDASDVASGRVRKQVTYRADFQSPHVEEIERLRENISPLTRAKPSGILKNKNAPIMADFGVLPHPMEENSPVQNFSCHSLLRTDLANHCHFDNNSSFSRVVPPNIFERPSPPCGIPLLPPNFSLGRDQRNSDSEGHHLPPPPPAPSAAPPVGQFHPPLSSNSPSSSMSQLLPSVASYSVPFSSSFTLGRYQSRNKGPCTRRPSESFV